jgi:hypothetical protein
MLLHVVTYDCVARSFGFCVMFCRSLFVLFLLAIALPILLRFGFLVAPLLCLQCQYRLVTADPSQVTNKCYHIMLYASPWSRFGLTTSVVLCTDCISSCKSNCHTITTTFSQIRSSNMNKITSLIHSPLHMSRCSRSEVTPLRVTWVFASIYPYHLKITTTCICLPFLLM